MSLYNILFGQNTEADKLLALLRTAGDCDPARYRDCYFDGTDIVVHTRTGGGNREDYVEDNEALTLHPWYVRDEDCDYDQTYANFYFRPPAELAATLQRSDSTPAERWEQLFKQLEAR